MQSEKNTHLNDEEILQNFYHDHDNDWLGLLLPRYTLLILGVCMKYLKNEDDAKDCVQHVFLKVIDELHKYRVEYFKSWIYMIAKNHCLMKLRDKGRTYIALNEEITKTPDETTDKFLIIEKDILLTKMEKCLQDLIYEQRWCVTLFYLEKKSYAEIARLTGFSMLQVKSYIQNGKRNLKLMMEENEK
ncbi:MAG: sigma-70 family RNA polymerase sigma factor [Ginsengibacter sp.]